MDFTNLALNPSFAEGLDQWYAFQGATGISVSTGMGRSASGYAVIDAQNTAGSKVLCSQNIVPCKPGDGFYAEAWALAAFAFPSSEAASVGLSFYDVNGDIILALGGNGVNTNGAWVRSSLSATAPANAASVIVWVAGNFPSAPVDGGMFFIDDVVLRRMADASLIVDGSITATKIAAGAISANMITAGELTANVIYFSDGFCLNTLEPKEAGANVTSAHVLTSTLFPGSGWSVYYPPNTWAAIPGFAWTVIASGPNDVFNCAAVLDMMGGVYNGVQSYTDVWLCLAVDGNGNNSNVADLYVYSDWRLYTAFFTQTGLSAGAHTITLLMNVPVSGKNATLDCSASPVPGSTHYAGKSYATLQRIF
jgi:hypothetical protein